MKGSIRVHAESTAGGAGGGHDRTIGQNPREQWGGHTFCLALQVHSCTVMNGGFSVTSNLHTRGTGPDIQGS